MSEPELELESDPESAKEGSYTPVRLRREHTCPSVTLQFQNGDDYNGLPSTAFVQRKSGRPRSASYVALRSAVYQITSLSDFTREKIGSGFFADVYKVRTCPEIMNSVGESVNRLVLGDTRELCR